VGKSASDTVVDRLKGWGVSRIFGHSGEGINSLVGGGIAPTEAGSR
jgi:pyruvate dehydrogenase (quinone)